MKKNIFVLLLLICCSFRVSADQVSCERFENNGWSWGAWKTCHMRETTEINSADTTIASRYESVQGLIVNSNKKIKFLPVGMSEKFPNLGGLEAGFCSLTTISKANFKGLSKLRGLYLGSNQIEKITSDVFDDLVALEYLDLGYNKLKFINGKAFARLTKLTGVYLGSNQCINENFGVPSRIAVLQQTVNEKCSFNEETENVIETTTEIISVDKKCDENQNIATFTNITLEGMKAGTSAARSEIISKFNELKTQQKEECGSITRALEAQTKALEAQTKVLEALKDQQIYLNNALEHKTAEIVDVKVKSETQTMLKMSEIQRLEEQLQRKNAEIIEKNGKIKKLEEKNEILMNCGNFR